MPHNKAQIQTIKFSVVIPAYNAASTIERALNSCLQQSYKPYEVIIIDDASTDDTEQQINPYLPHIKYIKLPVNSGSSLARNKGIEAATGDYIAFLDADDIWHQDKLLTISRLLSTNPEIYFLFHPFSLTDINNISIPEIPRLYYLPFLKLLIRNVIGTPCVVLRNDKKYFFDTSMRYMEDYDLWLRIGYRHKLYFVSLPLTQISRPVLSKGGLSANRKAMRKGEIRAYINVVKLQPIFIVLLPFLLCLSVGKHMWKMATKK